MGVKLYFDWTNSKIDNRNYVGTGKMKSFVGMGLWEALPFCPLLLPATEFLNMPLFMFNMGHGGAIFSAGASLNDPPSPEHSGDRPTTNIRFNGHPRLSNGESGIST